MTEPSSLKSMLSLIEGRPLAMIGFARTLIAKGETMTAHDLCRRALALAPDDPEVSAAVKQVFSHDVPDWHFWILNDEQRNKAHDAALRDYLTRAAYMLVNRHEEPTG